MNVWFAHGCTYRVWVVCCCHALAVKQESHTGNVLSLAVTESIHKLAEGSGSLNLEEDLVVIIGDLDVEMLALACVFGFLRDVG